MSIIKTVPIQRVIKTNKEPCGKEHLYTPINLKAMQNAMKELSGNAFKMWCYLGKNQDKYIDIGSNKIEVYPDTAADITRCINNSGLQFLEHYETEFANVFICRK